MFTVAPSGKTKLEIPLETPTFFSRTLIVTGKVADEDAVEKPVSSAGDAALSILSGFTFAINLNNKGSTIRA
jgi:hypothetical protein